MTKRGPFGYNSKNTRGVYIKHVYVYIYTYTMKKYIMVNETLYAVRCVYLDERRRVR